jgi:23S rRNA (guanosine2251-2'-O)-methyltransferase
MREYLYGRNAVYETLRAARRTAYGLLAAQGAEERGRLGDILRICQEKRIPIERVPRARLDKISPHAQGVALEAGMYPYSGLPDMLELARERGEPLFLLVLDTLQDPQNLGTLLRTAEVVGLHGVLLPLRQTVTVTPAVVNASSGACEHLLIAQANLAQSLERIKEAGAWVIGLEGSAQALPPGKVRLDGPLALVVGSEGEGMRPLVRAACDLTLRLPMRGRVASLNAAVAGSVALYLAWQARRSQDWTA